MIRVTCSHCGAVFDTDDKNAGRRGHCTNCQAPLTIPAAGAPAAPDETALKPPAAGPGLLTRQPRLTLVILLWLLFNGMQYFYLGQIGKGIIFTAIEIICLVLEILTLGLFLFFHAPWKALWLIDSIIVHHRLAVAPVSRWRFF